MTAKTVYFSYLFSAFFKPKLCLLYSWLFLVISFSILPPVNLLSAKNNCFSRLYSFTHRYYGFEWKWKSLYLFV